MELNITPHPKQAEALKILKQDKINTLFYGGARGGGKSHLARLYAVMRALRYPGSRVLIVRSSFPDLTRSVIDNIKKEYKGVYQEYKEKTHAFYFSNGSTIECTYLQNDVDLETVQGVEYSTIILEEASQHYKKTFDTLRLSLRDSTGIPCKMLCTFNWTGKGFSWLKRLCWDKIYDGLSPEKIFYLRALMTDNPSIPETEYLNMFEGKSEETRKREQYGDPSGGAEGLFFTEFNPTMQKEQPFPLLPDQRRGRLFGALDHGTSHSTAFQLAYIDKEGVIHILFTYCANGMTAFDHAQAVYDAISSFKYTSGMFPSTVWVDPAAFTEEKLNPNMIRSPVDEYKDLFKRLGAPTKFGKANNNRANGSQMMRNLLSQNRIRYFDGYNKSYEEGMQSAITDPNNIESYKKVSTDGDDVVDVSRYLSIGCLSVMNNLELEKPKINMSIKKPEKYLFFNNGVRVV